MFEKRMSEIKDRKLELRNELENNQEANLEEIKTEIESLENEVEELKEKQKVAEEITEGATEERKIEKPQEENTMEERNVFESKEYRSAFLKNLQGKPLNEVEKREFVLTPPGLAGSGAAVVPTQTANMIFDNMIAIAPMLNEINLMRVKGNLRFAVQGVRNAAAVHVEGVAVVPAADTMVNVTLTGYEFMKVIRISATVANMSIDMFESWITKTLAEDLAIVLDNEIINGGSVTGNINTAQAWVNGVNQITYVPGAGLTYNDITNLIALLPSAFDRNAKFLMSKATFYRQVLGMVDAVGNPIAVPDIASQGRYMMLGYPVLIDDNVTANFAFLGDFKQVVGNLADDIKIARSSDSGFLNNAVDYRGTALFDCDIAQPTAIVRLAV